MKLLRNYLRPLVLVTVISLAAGCNNYLEVNLDPTRPLNSPTSLLLTSALAAVGFNGGSDMHRYTLLFAQQMAAQNGRQTENFDAFIIQASELNGLYRNQLYGGPLADLEQIINRDPAITHPAYLGIAKLVKAYNFSLITDLWGDVPFSEALKGVENLQPKVDNSREIYAGLITLIDQGVADLARTSPLVAPAADDLIYAGNASRWIRFGNTLKLRLYLHMLQGQSVTPEVVATFVRATEAATVGFMTAPADDFQMRFEATANRQNSIHQFIVARTDDLAVSATIVNLMNGKADPRRAAYFTPAPFTQATFASPPSSTTGGYIGLANGTGGGGVRNDLSRLHTYVRGNVTSTNIPVGPTLTVAGLAYDGTAPVQMLTFAEYNFIRAELALRYSGPGVVQEFFQRGIRASFTDANLAAQADAYIARAGTLAGSAAEQLRQLIEEKYVANFMVAVEPWNDWRRTGFPVLSAIPANIVNPQSNGRFPRVLLYPQQEVSANPNYMVRGYNERPVFWDTRTTGQQ